MQQFEAYRVIGTKERLAYELHRHAGQRRSDVYKLGKQPETKDGWLKVTQFKGRNTKPQPMEIPIFDELRAIPDGSPTGDMTYLVSEAADRLPRPRALAGFSVEVCLRRTCPAYQRTVYVNRPPPSKLRHKALRRKS